jgi:hypothetical protein
MWGANATGPVTVTVGAAKATSPSPGPGGSWMVTLPNLDVALTTTVAATDGKTTQTLTDVAIGDVILCGGRHSPVVPHPRPFPDGAANCTRARTTVWPPR